MLESPSNILRFSSITNVRHVVTTRRGGVSRAPYATLNLGYGTDDEEEAVSANRAALLCNLGITAEQVIQGLVTHGNHVSVFSQSGASRKPQVRRPVRDGSLRTESFFLSDGVISDVPGLHFLLTFADCVPLIFHDPVRHVVGAAHAGWRGTAAQIGPAVMRSMEREFGCERRNIVVGIGPSIGPCCYPVGPEVITTFERLGGEACIVKGQRAVHLDLWSTNERQVRASGAVSVERSDICTACNTHTFFSHRAEAGITGRFGMLAGLSGGGDER